MKLYDLPQRQPEGEQPKIYGLAPNGDEGGIVYFDHLDGAYSYCMAVDSDGKDIGPVHLSASTPLVKYKDGYKVAASDD